MIERRGLTLIQTGYEIISRYELNNVNINRDRLIDRLMWYGFFFVW